MWIMTGDTNSGFIAPNTITTMRSPSESLGLGILAICINASLMIIKIGVGVVGNSYALIADGIESASDIFSSVITWAGFRLSLKPADEDHPYGHGKIDALTGMFFRRRFVRGRRFHRVSINSRDQDSASFTGVVHIAGANRRDRGQRVTFAACLRGRGYF
jgi:hypothetical protein